MSGERVLIIDDDLKLSEQVSDYLSQQGLEPSRAADGNEALSMLAAHSFDLVLLDVIMPGMDGFAVCRKIREDSQTPIIMLTAIGDEAAKIQMLQTGADDYVVKPFSLPELCARIVAVLRRSRLPARATKIRNFPVGNLKSTTGRTRSPWPEQR